jgi:hypothetical protein
MKAICRMFMIQRLYYYYAIVILVKCFLNCSILQSYSSAHALNDIYRYRHIMHA